MASLSEVLAGEEEEEGLQLRPAGFGAAVGVVGFLLILAVGDDGFSMSLMEAVFALGLRSYKVFTQGVRGLWVCGFSR